METIFDHNPTKEELAEIYNESDNISKADYLNNLKKIASTNNSSEEYEATVDLEELFNIRGDFSKMNEYTHLIATKFSNIRKNFFNE